MPRVNVKTRKTRSRWSHENKGCVTALATEVTNGLYQSGSVIVPPSAAQGTRTVGRFDITVPSPVVDATVSGETYWALVYVPQGTTANALFATSGTPDGSLYEPNQYVIASGISDNNAGPIRIRSRYMRILHSGDFVSLIVGTVTAPTAKTANRALVSYNVKYN